MCRHGATVRPPRSVAVGPRGHRPASADDHASGADGRDPSARDRLRRGPRARLGGRCSGSTGHGQLRKADIRQLPAVRGKAQEVPPVQRRHPELPEASGLAVFPEAGQGSIPSGTSPRSREALAALSRRGRGRRPGPARQLGPGPHPVPPLPGARGQARRLDRPGPAARWPSWPRRRSSSRSGRSRPGRSSSCCRGPDRRTVRRWAIRRIEADLARTARRLSAGGVDRPARARRPRGRRAGGRGPPTGRGARRRSGVDRWLALAESTQPGGAGGRLRADRALRPARARSRSSRPSGWRGSAPCRWPGWASRGSGPRPRRRARPIRRSSALVEAECEPLRPEILRWLRATLAPSADSSRRWSWSSSTAGTPTPGSRAGTGSGPSRGPATTSRPGGSSSNRPTTTSGSPWWPSWSRGRGERRPVRVERSLDPEALRQLWAAVLLNVHRGGRAKPPVVRQLLRRLEASPADAPRPAPPAGRGAPVGPRARAAGGPGRGRPAGRGAGRGRAAGPFERSRSCNWPDRMRSCAARPRSRGRPGRSPRPACSGDPPGLTLPARLLPQGRCSFAARRVAAATEATDVPPRRPRRGAR